MLTLGDKVKSRRIELGLTLQQLADKIGVSNATVQRYESGRIKTPRSSQIRALASALNVSPNYLFDIDCSAPEVVASGLSELEEALVRSVRSMPYAARAALLQIAFQLSDPYVKEKREGK